MSDRRCTEITRMCIVRIEHQLFQYDFRVYHIHLKRMQSRLFHFKLRHNPTQIVEDFIAAETIPFDQFQRLVSRWKRFEFRGFFQVLRGIFTECVYEPLTGIQRTDYTPIQTKSQSQPPVQASHPAWEGHRDKRSASPVFGKYT